jgi:hypothetical protein
LHHTIPSDSRTRLGAGADESFSVSADGFDFTGFDVNTTLGGTQQLVYGSGATATGLWTQSVGNDTVIYVDTDGNLGTVELMFTLTDNHIADSADLLGVAKPSGLSKVGLGEVI